MSQTYLITGGAGSFGKAFLKDLLLNCPVKQVRVFSRDEFKHAQLKAELNDPRLECLIGDVRDYDRLVTAMQDVDVVIHAAALKRVEACERDPQEAIKTNVTGTINVANAALACGVKSAVLISTDKAVYPINLYGATKMVAEKTWIQSNVYRGATKPTRFTVVRYGNVVGSRGSVIPLFREQAKDGVVSITHPEMTRFLITLKQAVGLVHAAVELGQGGEIFLPQLKSVNISELASLIAPDARQITIGLRPGEKMHEVLFSLEEVKRMNVTDIYCLINPEFPTWNYTPAAVNVDPGVSSSFDSPRFTKTELKELLRAN